MSAVGNSAVVFEEDVPFEQDDAVAEVLEAIEAHTNELKSMAWFLAKPESVQKAWLANLANMATAAKNGDGALMWECAIDHMHETDWDFDTGLESWQDMYQLVDDLRTEWGVDSV
jgi:hypothetical protein